MTFRFTELVDIEAFRSMLSALYDATGILHGLVDADNEVISAAGWQEACTLFHRAHPCTRARCHESNRELSAQVGSAPYVGIRCGNGLMDYAAPITVEGQQLATLYFGQCFHEPPDLERFRAQARECGFDQEAYLATIRKVPIIPRERIDAIMRFFAQLAQMHAQLGLDRLRLREAEQRLAHANRDLAARVEHRTRELATSNAQLRAEIDVRRRTEDALRESKGTLQAILDSSPVGIGWSCGATVEYMNPRLQQLFGYALEDVPTLDRLLARILPDGATRDAVVSSLTREASHRAPRSPARFTELPVLCKDGTTRYVVAGVSWAGERRVATLMDVTDRWLADQREEAWRVSLEMIASDAPVAQTVRTIIQGVQLQEPELLCAVLVPAVDGVRVWMDRDDAADGAADVLGVAPIEHHPDCRARTSPGAPSSCWRERIVSRKGQELGSFLVCQRAAHEVSRRERLVVANAVNLAAIAIARHHTRLALEQQAQTDFLTGLANRRHLIHLADAELARAQRSGRPFSLLMLDVDHFKAVNDTHGHEVGDLVLQTVAATARETLRSIDTVGRLGGEEFAIVLPECDTAGALETAERLRVAVARAATSTSGREIRVTISVGVASVAEGLAGIDALFTRADRALYEAKRGGRNRVCVADGCEAW
jgi:diguanylate cyclase (GGDEF)-like protein